MSWSRTQILESGCLGSNLSSVICQWSDLGQGSSLSVPQFPHYESGSTGRCRTVGSGENSPEQAGLAQCPGRSLSRLLLLLSWACPWGPWTGLADGALHFLP